MSYREVLKLMTAMTELKVIKDGETLGQITAMDELHFYYNNHGDNTVIVQMKHTPKYIIVIVEDKE